VSRHKVIKTHNYQIRRETFTLRRLILKPLAKELNKQMTKHWHIKLAEMGYKVQ